MATTTLALAPQPPKPYRSPLRETLDSDRRVDGDGFPESDSEVVARWKQERAALTGALNNCSNFALGYLPRERVENTAHPAVGEVWALATRELAARGRVGELEASNALLAWVADVKEQLAEKLGRDLLKQGEITNQLRRQNIRLRIGGVVLLLLAIGAWMGV